MVAIAGPMLTGGTNRFEIAVCSIPALLAMKGHAIEGRYKQKDAYDVYYCIRNYPGGPQALWPGCFDGTAFAHSISKTDSAALYRLNLGDCTDGVW